MNGPLSARPTLVIHWFLLTIFEADHCANIIYTPGKGRCSRSCCHPSRTSGWIRGWSGVLLLGHVVVGEGLLQRWDGVERRHAAIQATAVLTALGATPAAVTPTWAPRSGRRRGRGALVAAPGWGRLAQVVGEMRQLAKGALRWGNGGWWGLAGERRCCWCWLWGCWKWGWGGWCWEMGPIWGEKLPPKPGLTWWEKFWNSRGPLLAEAAGLKKLMSSLMMVEGVAGIAADQLLKLVREEEVLDWAAVPSPEGSW